MYYYYFLYVKILITNHSDSFLNNNCVLHLETCTMHIVLCYITMVVESTWLHYFNDLIDLTRPKTSFDPGLPITGWTKTPWSSWPGWRTRSARPLSSTPTFSRRPTLQSQTSQNDSRKRHKRHKRLTSRSSAFTIVAQITSTSSRKLQERNQ